MSNKTIQGIQKMFNNGVFPKHISYIRFPLFRNLERNSKITFDFPLTFLVGKNGGGKSSTLQAIYGCPLNYSLGSYWFSTAVDPIVELKDNRNCFIYGYKDGATIKEVLQQRSQVKGNPDYWETSRPLKKYQMDSTRNPPIDKKVEYIDFRSELSAFDSYMYFMPLIKSNVLKTKQDFIRKRSKKIKDAFDTNNEVWYYGKRSNKVEVLSGKEITDISYILGKEYTNIEVLNHNLFNIWGFSVKFSSPDLKYSEAFAGSGETAIIVLIHKIHHLEDNSLLLLDEPETSLHPGAQKRLIEYLLEQIKIKKLQVVISTHSPFLIEGMPAESIKVFSLKDSFFHIENSREPKEAFYELEIENTQKTTIVVEDLLAKEIVEYALKKKGPDIFETFNVKYLPGGSGSLKQRIVTYIENEDKPYILFDGDQKLLDNPIDLTSIPTTQIDTYNKLSTLLITQTGAGIKFFLDGNNGVSNEEQKILAIKKYFKYYQSFVCFLPKNIPEEIIWNDALAKNKIELFCLGDVEEIFLRVKIGNAKEWFVNLCNEIYNDISSLPLMHKDFIIFWLKKGDNEDLTQIELLIEKFRK